MKKLETREYQEKLLGIFGANTLTQGELNTVTEKIRSIREEAFELFKQKNFYGSACFYKALLENTLSYLTSVEDDQGKLGDAVYEFIKYYSEAVKNCGEIDKESFFDEGIKLYIEEDLGFTDEISKMIVNNIQSEDESKHVAGILNNKIENSNLSKYIKNKLVELLLKIHRKYNDYKNYLKACKLFSEDRWERYTKPSEIYESLGEWENALKMLEEGKNELPQHKDIFENRYEEIRKMILGL